MVWYLVLTLLPTSCGGCFGISHPKQITVDTGNNWKIETDQHFEFFITGFLHHKYWAGTNQIFMTSIMKNLTSILDLLEYWTTFSVQMHEIIWLLFFLKNIVVVWKKKTFYSAIFIEPTTVDKLLIGLTINFFHIIWMPLISSTSYRTYLQGVPEKIRQ